MRKQPLKQFTVELVLPVQSYGCVQHTELQTKDDRRRQKVNVGNSDGKNLKKNQNQLAKKMCQPWDTNPVRKTKQDDEIKFKVFQIWHKSV